MSLEANKPAAPAAGAAVSPTGASAATGEWTPKIVGIFCNWCSYAGADLAGTSRLSYPESIRIIRVPCSGRVNPQFIMRAFQNGADGVLIGGCHPGDCHYSTGNMFTRRRLMIARRFIEYLGIDPRRLQARWMSASEASKFQDQVKSMTESIKALGPNPRKGASY